MKPQLSVIIPVFKVEDYLERCVKSVLTQDYRDLEVILVDDGSPDRCPQICDELAETDERIIVIHKPNGGLSSARNAGIEKATGEYLAFLDSDDQWAEGKLKTLMSEVVQSSADIVFYASRSIYEDGALYQRAESNFFTGVFRTTDSVNLYKELIDSGNLHESACTKIVKRNFILDNGLKFKSGMLCEDTEWMFRVLRTADNVAISSVPLFICTENRAGSITNTASTRSIRDMLSIIEGSLAFYSNSDSITKQYELAHCAYLWSICVGLYNTIPSTPPLRQTGVRGMPSTDRKEIRTRLCVVAKSLDLNSHPKSRKVSMVYRLLGFRFTANILGLYLKLLRKNLVNKKKPVNGKEN